MKILSIIGTRPEAIKMAPVVLRLEETDGVTHRLCVTAQHRSMLDQVVELFGLRIDHDLDLMRPAQQLADLTARALAGVTDVLREERPDWVLVQGDTTTVFASALAAFYEGIRVGHVEAGLRSFDMAQPFPEEMNRRFASVVANLHFAPTARSRDNLLREGIDADSIVVTGNPVIDALRLVRERSDTTPNEVLSRVPPDARLILVTCHRRENFGPALEDVFSALLDVLDAVPDSHIVYPVHPNPNVCRIAHEILGSSKRATLLEPLDYLPLVQLMRRSELVITDSGGIQEEAPGLGKPVLVLREVTERPEAVDAGTVRLVGTSRQRIREEAVRLLTDNEAYESMARAVNPYGDGFAAERIVESLLGRPVAQFA